MNILFTVCARSGSKGAKNKNIRVFSGIPIAYLTISAFELFKEAYKNEFDLIDMALNTDSDDLFKQFNDSKVEFNYIPRKIELAGDAVAKPEVIRDTLNSLEKQTGNYYDIVVDLDLTSPIRTIENIKGLVDQHINNDVDVSFSMVEARRSPYFNMVSKKEDTYFSTVINSNAIARQEVPECFDMNASIYAYKHDFISNPKTKRVFDGRALGYLVNDSGILDIDSDYDFNLIECIARYFFYNYPEYRKIMERASKYDGKVF